MWPIHFIFPSTFYYSAIWKIKVWLTFKLSFITTTYSGWVREEVHQCRCNQSFFRRTGCVVVLERLCCCSLAVPEWDAKCSKARGAWFCHLLLLISTCFLFLYKEKTEKIHNIKKYIIFIIGKMGPRQVRWPTAARPGECRSPASLSSALPWEMLLSRSKILFHIKKDLHRFSCLLSLPHKLLLKLLVLIAYQGSARKQGSSEFRGIPAEIGACFKWGDSTGHRSITDGWTVATHISAVWALQTD